MRNFVALLTALFTLAFSCVAFASTDITSGNVEAEGLGDLNQSPRNGYIAAKLSAMEALLEQVKGVTIDADTTVEQGIVTNDVIHAKVDGVIKGAKEVRRWKDADGYHMIMSMPVFGANSLASAVIPEVKQVPLPEPSIFQLPNLPSIPDISSAPSIPSTPVTPVTAPVRGNYTGLIVDCTGLGLSTAMAPGIYSANQSVVYGLEHLNHEVVINRGYVGYSNGMSNVGRAGNNPLIVRAISLRDNAIRPVISDADAMTILSENQVTGFLTAGNVVFMK